MDKPKEKVNILTLMVLPMMVIGFKINNMVLVLKNGVMEPPMKGNIVMVKKMGKVILSGKIIVNIKDHLILI